MSMLVCHVTRGTGPDLFDRGTTPLPSKPGSSQEWAHIHPARSPVDKEQKLHMPSPATCPARVSQHTRTDSTKLCPGTDVLGTALLMGIACILPLTCTAMASWLTGCSTRSPCLPPKKIGSTCVLHFLRERAEIRPSLWPKIVDLAIPS